MKEELSAPEPMDVPQQIFKEFVVELRKTETPVEVINEIEQLISTRNPITEASLKAALAKHNEI